MTRPTPPASPLSVIEPDMRRVDQAIAEHLGSEVPLVREVSSYLIAAGGKRLRPALLLLVAGALGCTHPARHSLAAVVEFIHSATLLHDDVVDESSLRRGRATANHRFGNAASVLVGDFLYSRAFQMMVLAQNMRVMEVLSHATNVIAEGEVLQLINTHDPNVGEDTYLHVIRSKTAKLFEASAQLGAILSGAAPGLEAQCAALGRSLGTAFQVMDDILDYEGDAQVMGKNLGDDLREGKVTLPLICAMRASSDEDRAALSAIIEAGDLDRMPFVMEVVRRTGALEAARGVARREAAFAMDAANHLPDGMHRNSLLQLSADLLHRTC